MSTFFQNENNKNKLDVSYKSWLGQPFLPYRALKGYGADCIHLIARILAECGFEHDFTPPNYAINGCRYSSELSIETYLSEKGIFQKINKDKGWIAGDIVTFSMGVGCPYHMGIMVSEHTFVHSVESGGVITSSIHDNQWEKRISNFWRPI